MKTIYVPKDFFDWIADQMEKTSRFGTPPSETAQLLFEIRWKDKLVIRVEED